MFVPTDVEKEYELEVDKETPKGKVKEKTLEAKMTASATNVGTSPVQSAEAENVVNATATQGNTSPATSKIPSSALTSVKTGTKQVTTLSSLAAGNTLTSSTSSSATTTAVTTTSVVVTTTVAASPNTTISPSAGPTSATTADASKAEPTVSVPSPMSISRGETTDVTGSLSKVITPTTTVKSSTPFMSFFNKRKIPSMSLTTPKITKIVIHKSASNTVQSANAVSSTVAPSVTSTSSSTVSNLTVTTATGIPWLTKSATPVLADSAQSSGATPVATPTIVVSSGQTGLDSTVSTAVQPYKSSDTTDVTDTSLPVVKAAPTKSVAQATTKPERQPEPRPAVLLPTSTGIPDLVPWYATPPAQSGKIHVSSNINSSAVTVEANTAGYSYNSQWQDSTAWQTSAVKPPPHKQQQQATRADSWSTNTATQYQYHTMTYNKSSISRETTPATKAACSQAIRGMEQYSEAGYEYEAQNYNVHDWYRGTTEQGEQSAWNQQTSSWGNSGIQPSPVSTAPHITTGKTSANQTYLVNTPIMVPPPVIPVSAAPISSPAPGNKLPDVPPPPLPKLATPPLPPFMTQQCSSTPRIVAPQNMTSQAEQTNWETQGPNVHPANLVQNQGWNSQLDKGPVDLKAPPNWNQSRNQDQRVPAGSGPQQPAPRLGGFQQPPLRMGSIQQPSPRMDSLQQPPPKMDSIQQTRPRMGNFQQRPPRIDHLKQPPPRLGSPQQRPRMDGPQQQPPRMGSLQQQPSRISGPSGNQNMGMMSNIEETRQMPQGQNVSSRSRILQSSKLGSPPPKPSTSQSGIIHPRFGGPPSSSPQNMSRLPQNQGPGGPLQQRLAHLAATNPLRPSIMRPMRLGSQGPNKNTPHILQAGDNGSPQSSPGQIRPYQPVTQSPRGPSAVPNLRLGPVSSGQKTLSPDQISPKDPLTKGWKTPYGQEFRSKLMGTATSSSDGWESACWPTTTDDPPDTMKTNDDEVKRKISNDKTKTASKVSYVFGSAQNKPQDTKTGNSAASEHSQAGNQFNRGMVKRQTPAPVLTDADKSKGQSSSPVSPAGKVRGLSTDTTASKVRGASSGPITTASKVRGPNSGSVTTASKGRGQNYGPVTTASKVRGPSSGPVTTASKVRGASSGPVTTASKVRGPSSGPVTIASKERGQSYGPDTTATKVRGPSSSPDTKAGKVWGPSSGPVTTAGKVRGQKTGPETTASKVRGPSTGPVTTASKVQGPSTGPVTTGSTEQGQNTGPNTTASKVRGPSTGPVTTASKVQGQSSGHVTPSSKVDGVPKTSMTKSTTCKPSKDHCDTTFSVGAFLSSLSAHSGGKFQQL